MTAAATKSRSLPGEALYAELTGRFVRLIEEHPDRALSEYGFTFINSIDESDAMTFLGTVGLSGNTWRERFLEAVALHRRGKLEEAERRYKALRGESKKNLEIDYNLAALYLQRGDIESARKHLDGFEKHMQDVDIQNTFVSECRTRIAELRAELEHA